VSDTVQDLKHGVLAFNGWHFGDAEARVDTLVAAVRAEERARLVALIASEECAHDLAHTVDDVNPRKTHTGDQEDAAIYCRHIAKYLAALTGADK
jgi:hypothetical protein